MHHQQLEYIRQGNTHKSRYYYKQHNIWTATDITITHKQLDTHTPLANYCRSETRAHCAVG